MSCCAQTVAVNLVTAVARAAKALAVGEELIVSPDVRRERLTQCGPCPHLIPATALVGPRCALCDCFVKAKAWLATEDCPDGRWLVALKIEP